MSAVPARRTQICDRLRDRLLGKGIPKALAETLAKEATDVIWDEFLGQRVYFARGRLRTLDPEQVWVEFDGRNHEHLAMKFKCSVRRIEQIVEERTSALKAWPKP